MVEMIYMSDEGVATNPGELNLSTKKLKNFHPLFSCIPLKLEKNKLKLFLAKKQKRQERRDERRKGLGVKNETE